MYIVLILYGISMVNVMQIHTATVSLQQIPLGKVVSVNGMNFVKVAENKYQSVCGQMVCAGVEHCAGCALSEGNACNACESGYMLSNDGRCLIDGGVMQTWNSCASLTTPIYTEGVKSTYFTQGPMLTDVRDGKSYEVRKFPDGKCWMVDNLKYGGTTTANGNIDACAGKTTFSGNGQATPYVSWYQGATQLYGDCRDGAGGGPYRTDLGTGGIVITDANNVCIGTGKCGYFYNWQAAIQLAAAYYGNEVVYPSGTPSVTNHIQGICPDGWHLPSGGTTAADSEFVALDLAVGGTGANNQGGILFTNFWGNKTDGWKVFFSGYVLDSGYNNVYDAANGERDAWWSSTLTADAYVYRLIAHQNSGYLTRHVNKEPVGVSVRCVAD
jgi:uncharacterized protein (TIGR02145 family)